MTDFAGDGWANLVLAVKTPPGYSARPGEVACWECPSCKALVAAEAMRRVVVKENRMYELPKLAFAPGDRVLLNRNDGLLDPGTIHECRTVSHRMSPAGITTDVKYRVLLDRKNDKGEMVPKIAAESELSHFPKRNAQPEGEDHSISFVNGPLTVKDDPLGVSVDDIVPA